MCSRPQDRIPGRSRHPQGNFTPIAVLPRTGRPQSTFRCHGLAYFKHCMPVESCSMRPFSYIVCLAALPWPNVFQGSFMLSQASAHFSVEYRSVVWVDCDSCLSTAQLMNLRQSPRLARLSNAALHTRVQVSVWTYVFTSHPRRGTSQWVAW